MDLMEEGNVSCGVNNCSTPGNCSNQDCQTGASISAWILIVCVTVSFISLMLFGFLGNTLTLLVVWLRPHMRSSAYLYLSSMAVSDLMILLLLALDLLKVGTGWNSGVFPCKLSMFLTECCTFCTMLHITFLSLERYLVVCWPITSKKLVTRRRTWALIGCLWLGAAVSAAPFLVMMEEDEIKVCRLSRSSVSSGLVLAMIILYYLYVLVPLCILGLVFILIGRTLRLRPQSSSKDKSNQHAVKMLGVIFLAFVLCWLPYIVALTMSYGSQRTAAESRGTNTDTNTHSDMNTPLESTGNMASVTEPVSLSDWDLNTQAHTDKDDALCENTNNEIDTHSEADAHLADSQPETPTDLDAGSDDMGSYHVVAQDVRPGESTHNLGHHTETHTHSAIHNTTHNKQNTTIKSQKDTLNLTTQTAGRDTYVVTPTDSTHNNTHTYSTHNTTHIDPRIIFFLVASILSRLSAAINPLLYNLMSARYRHAVRSLVQTHCLTPSHRLSTTLSSGYSTTTL